jgi:hypothetical protein
MPIIEPMGLRFKSVQEIDLPFTVAYFSPGEGQQDININQVDLDRAYIYACTYSTGWEVNRATINGKFSFLNASTVRLSYVIQEIQTGQNIPINIHATIFETAYKPKSIQFVDSALRGANAISQVNPLTTKIIPACFSGAQNAKQVRRCYLAGPTSVYCDFGGDQTHNAFFAVQY